MPARSRQLAAIMFTDIQGYTALMQRSETTAIQVREKHREVINRLTEKYHGNIVNYYGDGTLSIFDSVVDAVHCGHELQIQFMKNPSIPVRVGVHLGDIIVTDDDIIGNSVNIASRIESMGIVGSVLISDRVREEISNHEDLPCKYLGEYHLKNDKHPRKIYALDLAGLKIPAYGILEGKTQDAPGSPKRSGEMYLGIKWIKRHQQWIGASLSLIFVGIMLLIFFTRQASARWAREEALPAIEALYDKQDYRGAFLLANKAEKFIKHDAGLQRLGGQITNRLNFYSEPPGVEIFRKLYDAPEDQWEFLGVTPLEDKLTYLGPSLWKFQKDGYMTSIRLTGSLPSDSILIQLDTLGSIPEGMVRIEGDTTHLGFIIGLDFENFIQVNTFFIDQYEVTNIDFQKFVDAGGYSNPTYWKVPFVKDGDTLSFAKAMALFIDKTGRSSPATWELEEFPKGRDLYPVRGVSWYEANAYATFVGKTLPTVFHWNMAASIWFSNFIIPSSNIEGREVASVGIYQGISSSGVYDMAGNVREWSWNAADSNNLRYILGGAWNDPSYLFNEVGTLDQFDRTSTNGFRCIQNLEATENQHELLESIPSIKDFDVGNPVSDEVFSLFKRQFTIDKTPFNASIDSVPLANKDRSCQKITFDAAYGGERMSAYLYLPTNTMPPYQSVVYFPGSGAVWTPLFDPANGSELPWVDFVLKSGRALIYPILKGTHERNDGLKNTSPENNVKYREYVLMWVKDIIRSVDYLETRADIDTSRLAYYGFSWGARLGGVVLAVDSRFKAAVLASGGLDIRKPQEEVAVVNYLPRVKTPVRMLNGRHDICCFPVESSQKPFFKMLGTNREDKEHIIFEDVAHLPSRANLIKGTLDWYDKYLGKVKLTER